MPRTETQLGKTGFVNGVLSLRGLLAIMVATSHTMEFFLLANYSGSIFDQPDWRGVILKLAGNTINVPMIFFVISGMAISLSLERKENTVPGGLNYIIFVVRRILRLYPANTFALLGIIALAALFLENRPPIDFASYDWKSYPFQMDWLNGAVFNPLKWQSVVGNLALASWSMNLVVWSLYVEVCAIPVLPLFYKISREQNLYLDIAALAVLIIAACVLWDSLWIHYWFAFYLGMMIRTHGRQWAQFMAKNFGGVNWTAALVCVVMLSPSLTPEDWPPALLIQAFAAFTLICLIVWSEETGTLRALNHRTLRGNGRLSYAFYLWHYIILTIIAHELYLSFAPQIMMHYDWAMFLGAEVSSSALALGAAQLTYRYVEEPSIVFGKRLETFLHRSLLGNAVPEAGD